MATKKENTDRANRRLVTIVGAGFSGLVTALYLTRAGFRVEVIEREARPGGMLSTQAATFGMVETAANAILSSPRVEELFRYLQIVPLLPLPQARKRFIFRGKWPRRWPLGITGSLRVGFFLIRYWLAKTRLAPRPYETIRTWGERMLGREACRYLLEAALQGIYAGDPTRLSASLIVGRFFRKTASPQGTIRGSISTAEGMGLLITRLRERLEELGVTFRFDKTFAAPAFQPNHPMVIATSASDAAPILSEFDPMRAKALAAVEMLPLYSVTASFKEPPVTGLGFGCLFPPAEGRRALGVLLNSFIFSKRAKKGFSETWIFGGVHPDASGLESYSDDEFLNLTVEERQATLQGSAETHGYRVSRWPSAIPHYTIHLEGLMPELRGLRCNTILVGNYLGEIGLTRILELAVRTVIEIQKSGEWEGR